MRPRASGRPRRPRATSALHQELDRALTDLRGELNATLRPDLSELASGFLRDLTNGRYTELELDEDYGTTLLDDGDPKAVISGGEEDVANLALRLAISQMIAERAGQPLSLLVLDEIFGSLDEDRRGRRASTCSAAWPTASPRSSSSPTSTRCATASIG